MKWWSVGELEKFAKVCYCCSFIQSHLMQGVNLIENFVTKGQIVTRYIFMK